MKLLSHFLSAGLLLVAPFTFAQNSSPLWTNFEPEITPADEFIDLSTYTPPPEPEELLSAVPTLQALALSVPDSTDAEIVELAKSLDNDPIRIFNWVRNNIHYEHYYGQRKGAVLTFLEGSGNDLDQCTLLAELLEASGAASDVQYRRGRQRMALTGNNGINIYDFLGLSQTPFPGQTYEEAFGEPNPYPISDEAAKLLRFPFSFLSTRGTPGNIFFDDYASRAFYRFWLRVDIGGTIYELDPSFKTYETISGVDLLAAAGYSRADILSAADSQSTDPNYALDLSESGIESYLSGISQSILNELQDTYPNFSLAEIINGRRIIRKEITDLADAFPLSSVFTDRFNETNITGSLSSYQTTVRFRSGAIDYTLPIADLKGRRISLTASGNTVELRFDDDAPVATTTVNGATYNLKIIVKHPGGLGSTDDGGITYQKNDDYMYAILYGFSPSGRLLQKRNEQLREYIDDGLADDSREVRSEILNTMGLTWLYQTHLVSRMLAAQNEVSHLAHHRFGRMGQEQGFYIDVGFQFSGSRARDGVQDDSYDSVFQLGSLFASALEHGVIEQQQPGYSAVSTVNILRLANEADQRLYRTDINNWSTVLGELQNYENQITNLSNIIYNDQGTLFLPEDASVTAGIWTGTGYIVRTPNQAGMIIAGGYSGGYGTSLGDVTPDKIFSSFLSDPVNDMNPVTNPISFLPPPSHTAPSQFSFDPVDMSTGAFHLDSTDMTTGLASAPRGLSFSRNYRSNVASADTQNLGYGWTHNLHIRAAERTANQEALGSGTPEQAAALLTSTLIAADLYRDDGSATEWGIAALSVGWFTDELLENAVSITLGKDILQFIEQPDGSYTPPAGQTMTLRKVNDLYELEQRLGNIIYFDSDGRADRIEDVDGKIMNFHYHSDDRLDYVQDAYNRRLTFGYNADNRISGVACSTGRSIDYRYDSEGNLDRYTDPEGKYRFYIYEAATDPDGATPIDPAATASSEHRMVRLRNHDKEIITQNVYDLLGRVAEQYMHGDTNQTWKLRYAGDCNTEENPEGGIKCFFYDERGRSIATEDESGNRSSWVYDGQDQIVERTSASGEVTSFTFDGDHNLERIDYPRGGGNTVNIYDSLHRLTQTTDPEGNITQLVYASGGFHQDKNRPLQIIDPEGTTTLTYYESGPAAGQLHTSTDDDGLVTENAYDNFAHPDWMDAPGDFRTDFTYSDRGDLTEIISPRGIVTTFQYNARRQLTETIYDNGGSDQAIETLIYDNQARLATTIAAEDNDVQRVRTRTEYTATDKVDKQYLFNETAALEDDRVADFTYDGRDWNIAVQDAAGRQTDLIYFANGQLEQEVRPDSAAARNSSYIYDGDNRLLTQSHPGAPTVRSSGFTYTISSTADGDATDGYPKNTFTDPFGDTTVSEFDRLGRLSYYRNKQGNLFEFNYDGLGRTTEITTPDDHSTTTAYNHRGAPTQITEPSGQSTTFAYDPTTGRLSSQTDDVGTISYTAYDDDGNLLTLSEGGNTITRTYDNLGRVTSYTDSADNTLGYRYYNSGKLHKLIYPGGTENGTGHIEYTYWKTGRLKNVIDKLDSTSSPRTTTHYWNNDGTLERIVRPNGTERKITYDASARPWVIEEYTSAGQLILLYKNGYYPSDEVQSIYRLPEVQDLSTKPNVVGEMLYNDDNELISFEGQTVTHDLDGNMTAGPLPNGTMDTYIFDARNRLSSVDGLTYSYDAENIRTQVTGSDGAITYVTDPHGALSRVLSRTQDGQTTRYVYGVGLQYEVDASGNTVYYHFDHVGNTAALTDESETVIDEFRYSPYGTVTYQKNNYETPFQFGGFFGVQTDSNGLVHMRARYYNPLVRRFINSDPARDTWNWFAYANGNPVSYVDPSGLAANLANNSSGGVGSGLLDLGQTGIGLLGLVPGAGNFADGINASISGLRGNYVDAAIDGTSAIPGAGQIAGFGAIINRGGRGIGKIVDGVKSLFNVNKIPKPKGIPDNYVIKPSKKGGGTQYVNPNNPHDRVRAMPGNPKSPNPSQQAPYVKRQVDGKFLDKDGNVVLGDSPEAHIPLDQFNF